MDEGSDGRGQTALPRGTVTFLLTDVEGSTALWEADPSALAAAMERHEEILAEAISQNGGDRPLEQGEGDNVVAAFCRASDAAQAALAAQAGLQSEPSRDGVTIAVRMGLHTGEAHVVDDTSYAGPDLNRCARIRNLPPAGRSSCPAPRTTSSRPIPPSRPRFGISGATRSRASGDPSTSTSCAIRCSRTVARPSSADPACRPTCRPTRPS